MYSKKILILSQFVLLASCITPQLSNKTVVKEPFIPSQGSSSKNIEDDSNPQESLLDLYKQLLNSHDSLLILKDQELKRKIETLSANKKDEELLEAIKTLYALDILGEKFSAKPIVEEDITPAIVQEPKSDTENSKDFKKDDSILFENQANKTHIAKIPTEKTPTSDQEFENWKDLELTLHIDIQNELRTNLFLAHKNVTILIEKILEATSSSEIKARLLELQHPELKEDGMKSEITDENAIEPIVKEPPPYTQYSILEEKAFFSKIEDLVEKKNYKEALSTLGKIQESDSYYSEALLWKNKISNTAIKELRSEAAQAFQSAKQVFDKQARTSYLEKAKTNLELILSLYPEVSNKEDIARNLEVIKNYMKLVDESK